MEQRYQKGSNARQQQQRVRDRDKLENDKGQPDQIEQRGRDGNDFGPEPAKPAEREFAFLIMIEQAPAWQELAPVLLYDLHSAAGPSRALSFKRQIVLRQQPPA